MAGGNWVFGKTCHHIKLHQLGDGLRETHPVFKNRKIVEAIDIEVEKFCISVLIGVINFLQGCQLIGIHPERKDNLDI